MGKRTATNRSKLKKKMAKFAVVPPQKHCTEETYKQVKNGICLLKMTSTVGKNVADSKNVSLRE